MTIANIKLCDDGKIELCENGHIALCCNCIPSNLDPEYDLDLTILELATEIGDGQDGTYYCWGRILSEQTATQTVDACEFTGAGGGTVTELNQDCSDCFLLAINPGAARLYWSDADCCWYLDFFSGQTWKMGTNPYDPTGTFEFTQPIKSINDMRCDWPVQTGWRKDTITAVITEAAP